MLGMNNSLVRRSLLLISAAAPVAVYLIYLYIFGRDIPSGDDYLNIFLFSKFSDGSLKFQDLLLPISAHRPLIPRLIVFLTGSLTGLNMISQMMVGFFAVCLVALVLFAAFRKAIPGIAAAYFIPVLYLLFSIGQSETILWAACSVAWYPFILLGLLSFIALSRSKGPDASFALCLGLACASMLVAGTGMILWIVLILQIVLMSTKGLLGKRSSAIMLVLTAVIGLAAIYLNMLNVEFGATPAETFSALKNPLLYLYFLAYIGLIFDGFWPSVLFGTAIFAGYAVFHLNFIKDNGADNGKTGFLSVLSSLMLTSTLMSLLLVLTRINGSLGQELSSRYVTFSAVGVSALFLGTLIQYMADRTRLRKAVVIAVSAVCVFGVASSLFSGSKNAQIILKDRDFKMLLISVPEIYPDEMIAGLAVQPELIRYDSWFLRSKKLSLFSAEPPALERMTFSGTEPPVTLESFVIVPLYGQRNSGSGYLLTAVGKGRLFISVNNGPFVEAVDRVRREDLKDPSLKNAGLLAVIPSSVLPPGDHKMTLLFIPEGSKQYFKKELSVKI